MTGLRSDGTHGGSRADGRLPEEHRPVHIQRGYLVHAEGSALVTQGSTRVICAASISQALPEFRRGTGGGWITADYGMLPRSTTSRTPRTTMGAQKRSVEISRFLGRCLRAVVDLEILGPWLVQIDCDVTDADAGTRCAALTGGLVALRDALGVLAKKDPARAWPLREHVVGVSVALLESQVVVDPTYEEDRAARIDLTMAVTSSGRLVELHAASEADPYDRETLERMIDMGLEGARHPLQAQTSCWEG